MERRSSIRLHPIGSGLSALVAERVALDSLSPPRVASAGVNPAGKVTSINAGMTAGADSIDDLQVIRSGAMKRLFTEVYAPATLGQLLRKFTHGHTSQLASVARTHLVNLVARTPLLPGFETQAYVDIDSLLRPVYGHAKQGASFGHTKIAGALLWKCRSDPSDLLTSPTVAASSPAPAASSREPLPWKAHAGEELLRGSLTRTYEER